MGKLVKKFRAGQISATIWSNDREINGHNEEVLSVQFAKSYKDKDDKWQETNSLNVSDIPKATAVLNKAFNYITVKEEDSQQ